MAVAPWIVVRGNHESCSRAGQRWWRFLDPRPLVLGRDCNDAVNDTVGDFSDPYAIPLAVSVQSIVFDSSKVGVAPLVVTDVVYKAYSAQMRMTFELSAGVAHSFFANHHPILGFGPNPELTPTGLFPGNGSLQSVLVPINGERLFPSNFEALISAHIHLFELVSYSAAQPTQLVSGNGGAWADHALPRELPKGATPSPGALIGSIVSTNQAGFTVIERGSDGTWRIEARDRKGQLLTTCALRDGKTRWTPETLQ